MSNSSTRKISTTQQLFKYSFLSQINLYAQGNVKKKKKNTTTLMGLPAHDQQVSVLENVLQCAAPDPVKYRYELDYILCSCMQDASKIKYAFKVLVRNQQHKTMLCNQSAILTTLQSSLVMTCDIKVIYKLVYHI